LLSERFVVIDGLRFPDDHAFLTEVYGAQFLHIHVVTSRELRKVRFEAREDSDFDVAANQPVEQKSRDLERFARDVVENNGEIGAFYKAIDEILYRKWR
jgi:dephospho-CoA kinase